MTKRSLNLILNFDIFASIRIKRVLDAEWSDEFYIFNKNIIIIFSFFFIVIKNHCKVSYNIKTEIEHKLDSLLKFSK